MAKKQQKQDLSLLNFNENQLMFSSKNNLQGVTFYSNSCINIINHIATVT